MERGESAGICLNIYNEERLLREMIESAPSTSLGRSGSITLRPPILHQVASISEIDENEEPPNVSPYHLRCLVSRAMSPQRCGLHFQ